MLAVLDVEHGTGDSQANPASREDDGLVAGLGRRWLQERCPFPRGGLPGAHAVGFYR